MRAKQKAVISILMLLLLFPIASLASVASVTISGVTTEYSSLQEAFDTASATAKETAVTAVVTLLKDLGSETNPVTKTLLIHGGNIIFDMNGKTITAYNAQTDEILGAGCALLVMGGAVLEIKNGAIIDGYEAAVNILEASQVTLTNGKLSGDFISVYANNKSRFIMNGGVLETNSIAVSLGADDPQYANCEAIITGGLITSKQNNRIRFDVAYSTLQMSGGMVDVSCSFELYDSPSYPKLIQLSGGTFKGGLSGQFDTVGSSLNDFLANGYAYYTNNTSVTITNNQTQIANSVTIKPTDDTHAHIFDRRIPAEKYLAKEATCTTPRLYYKSCKCNESGTETFEAGAPKGHNFNTERYACMVEGHAKLCVVCGEHAAIVPHKSNNKTACRICGYDGYTIIEGAGQIITPKTAAFQPFRSDAKFDTFLEVQLNGKVLDTKTQCTVTEGSIRVTLKEEFVRTLPEGEHTLAIISSENGVVAAAVTVFEVASALPITELPQTGDNSNSILYMAMLLVSLASLYALHKRNAHT